VARHADHRAAGGRHRLDRPRRRRARRRLSYRLRLQL
jgi:hypothetical protein